MKLVVTGGLGHIGSLLMRTFLEDRSDLHLVVLDNLLTQRYYSLFNLPKKNKFEFQEIDVRNAELTPYFKDADAVIHLAAVTDAAASFDNQTENHDVNFVGTQKVAQACLECETPLFFPSTTSVYGKSNGLVDESCGEEDLKPQSPYAQSKRDVEIYLESLGKKGLRFAICRFGTVVGVSPGIRFHTAVNKFCFQAVMGRPITVWSTALKQDRPYLDLKDAIRSIDFILKNNLFKGDIFNVVTENLSVEKLIQMIKGDIPEIQIELVEHEIMNQLSYQVSAQKICDAGFKFQGDIKQSIHETIRLLH